MAAVGTLPGAAAVAGASVPQRQRRGGAPSFVAAYVPEGTRLVCERQLRPAPVLACSSIPPSRPARRRFLSAAAAAASSGSAGEAEPQGFAERYPTLVTGFFFFLWYFLNVIFNILNKKIFDYFPYPYLYQ
ncbi:unnamed protein product [Miscanthus lutarioriparius]|uniref:Uncharacterized protein n=1 Tax=Miscanthus lutarioriparius TaxID=422564 RepID=A0A811RYM8_9POAL|nr:unnamed protein product [Miscanthus lutarioriparius]